MCNDCKRDDKKIDNIECPRCKNTSISVIVVGYTQKGRYCNNCKFVYPKNKKE